MSRWMRHPLLATLILTAFAGTVFAGGPSRQTVAAFNDRFTHAIRTMNNAEAISLWADDGVSLLPDTNPIIGKAAVRQFMDDVTAKLSGYSVVAHDNEFHDIQVSGDWASEWALTTQVVQPPDGKPRITIYGKMLLVLHRDRTGEWKIKEESWTSRPAP